MGSVPLSRPHSSGQTPRAIADAVLYEGYLLWPYSRTALKNQRRWTFGCVFPQGHSRAHPDDRWRIQAQCVLEAGDAVEITVRFLHVVTLADGWEEAVEREVALRVGERVPIAIAAGDDGEARWEALEGHAEARADGGRISLEVANTTPWPGGERAAALKRTFCSAHIVLHAPGGRFASLTEPYGASCVNEGVWPVLVGAPDTMLASPIILEDYPRVAPESPGDLFDGGEIDGMLTLNILSLTDAEKAEMRAADPRAAAILDRTESLSDEQRLTLLEGVLRRG
jgi:hypothetical protein